MQIFPQKSKKRERRVKGEGKKGKTKKETLLLFCIKDTAFLTKRRKGEGGKEREERQRKRKESQQDNRRADALSSLKEKEKERKKKK